MSYTVEPSNIPNIEIIDISDENINSRDYGVRYAKKFIATETVEKIIVFDPRRDKEVQINANGQAYTLESTTHAGGGNLDISDSAVPWTLIEDATTEDFQSGGGNVNEGILAIRITSGTPAVPVALTDDFEIFK